MSDPRIRWRVKRLDDKSVVFEVMLDSVKVGEMSTAELTETLMQGVSTLRWADPKLR